MKRAELLKSLDLSSFIALDFETTGLSKFTDRIIEVAAIIFKDGKIADSFVTLVNPKIQISDTITNITGITNEMVSHAPTEQEIVEELHSFIGNYPLVAHNMKFDEGFLKELFNRYNLPVFISLFRVLPIKLKLEIGIALSESLQNLISNGSKTLSAFKSIAAAGLFLNILRYLYSCSFIIPIGFKRGHSE